MELCDNKITTTDTNVDVFVFVVVLVFFAVLVVAVVSSLRRAFSSLSCLLIVFICVLVCMINLAAHINKCKPSKFTLGTEKVILSKSAILIIFHLTN